MSSPDKKFKRSVYGILKKRDVSPITKENYYTKMNKLRKTISGDITNLDFLKNHIDEVIAYIESLNTNSTKKAYYISIYSLIKNSRRINKDIKKRYKMEMEKFRNKNNDERKDNIMTTKEKDNWLTLDELKKTPDKVSKIINETFGELFLTEDKYISLTKRMKQRYLSLMFEYVLLSVYCCREPFRLDFAMMKVAFNKLPESKEDNYLLVKDNGMTIFMNKFKNVKKIGKQTSELSSELVDIMTYWFQLIHIVKKKKAEYVFYLVKGDLKMVQFPSTNTFGKKLSTTFKKYTGKNITINLIRKIWETEMIQSEEYSQMTIREKENVHKKLLHGTSVAGEYNRINRI